MSCAPCWDSWQLAPTYLPGGSRAMVRHSPGAGRMVLELASLAGMWRVIAAQVPGVGPLDPASATTLCAVVFALSTLAAWIPARRAVRTDTLATVRLD